MLIVCCACHGRKLVSPLGGMPLPCAICNGIGFTEIEQKKNDDLPEMAPSNKSPNIDLQEKPKTQQELLQESVNDFKRKMVNKKSMKKYRIKQALKNIKNHGLNV